MLTVGVWEEPSGDYVAFLLEAAGIPVERIPAHQSLRAVRAQSVRVGMIPTLAFLREPEDFQIIPYAGLVTSAYPFAKWVVRSRIDKMKTVSVDPKFQQEILLLRILANEHYQTKISVVARSYTNPSAFLENVDSGLIPEEAYNATTGDLVLDLGREWYELTTRPFPWGLLVSLKGEVDTHEIEPIQIAMTDESGPHRYANSRSLSSEMTDYVFNDVRKGFDEEALLGLQAFATHCFYYGVIDQIPDVTFLSGEGDENLSEEHVGDD